VELEAGPRCIGRVRALSGVAALVAVVAAALPAVSVSASDPWVKLHRPLRLAPLAAGATCPVSTVDTRVDWASVNIFGGSGIGPGPVYPGLGTGERLEVPPDEQYGGIWGGQKVFWYVAPSYRGRVLIRGRRLDGPERLRFDDGRLPAAELRIERAESVFWDGQPPGSRGRPSGLRARASGCYGVQIDGSSFSRVVVFEVALVP
jgi:hypothetical protein